MNKQTYRTLNLVCYLFITVAFIVIQTTLFSGFPFDWIRPDIAFIIAVYFGWRRGMLEGGIMVASVAAIMHAHSGATESFFLIVYLYVFLLAKLLRKVFATQNFWSGSIGMGTMLWLFKFAIVMLLFRFDGKHGNALKHNLLHLIPGLAAQIAFMPVLFSMFQKLDLAMYSDVHAEDEYDLNKEI